ncbi:unnamed protein product [Pylaiella littoralis]
MALQQCPSAILSELTPSEKKSLAGLVAVSLPADDLADGMWSLTFLEDILQLLGLDKELAEGYYPITEASRRELPPPVDVRAEWEKRVEPFRTCLPPLGEPRTVVLRDLMVIVALRCGYDARTRVTFRRVCDALQAEWHPRVSEVESTLARKVYERIARDRERELRTDRWRGFKIGAAMIGGGTLLAVTGGLAAPALAAGIAASSSVIGASAAATLSGFATTAWMATLFGAGGAGLVGYKMDRRTQGVKEFEFESETSVGEEMCVSICVPGVLKDKGDLQRGWGVEPRGADVSAKERLRRFYYVYNRAKVADVEDILVAYDGKESKLCRALVGRYGADPRDPLTREALARAEGRAIEGVSQVDLARDAEAIEQLMEIVLQKEKEDKEKSKVMAETAAKLAKKRQTTHAAGSPAGAKEHHQGADRKPSPASTSASGGKPAAVAAAAAAAATRTTAHNSPSRSGHGDDGKPSPSATWAASNPERSAGSAAEGAARSSLPSPPDARITVPEAAPTATAAKIPAAAGEAAAGAEAAAAAAMAAAAEAAEAAAATTADGGAAAEAAAVSAGVGSPPTGTESAAAEGTGGELLRDWDRGADGQAEGEGSGLLRDWDRGGDGQVEGLRQGVNGLSLPPVAGAAARASGGGPAAAAAGPSDDIELLVEADGMTDQGEEGGQDSKKEDLLKHRVWFWQDKLPHTDQYVLRWESDWLVTLGKSVETIIRSLSQSAMQETLKYTTLAAIMTSLAWPLALMSLSNMIDADWTIGRERADVAGKILADALLNREQGCRPVTLVGTSLGARLIFACLEEIARRHELWEEQMIEGGEDHHHSKMTRLKNAVTRDNRGKSKTGLHSVGPSGGTVNKKSGTAGGTVKNESGAMCAAGVIENVCLLGAPVGATSARWERVARVVHGRIINGYSKSDIILGLVFRAKSLSLSVAGIQKVSAVGVENVDLSSVVGSNHFNYNRKMPEILELLDLDNCSKYIRRGDPGGDSSPAPAGVDGGGSGVDGVVYGTTHVP